MSRPCDKLDCRVRNGASWTRSVAFFGGLGTAVVSLLVLVAACTFTEVASTPTESTRGADQAALRSLAHANEVSTELRRAQGELIRRCMVGKGDQYVVNYTPSRYVYTPYKGLSVQEASEYGYRELLGHTPESDAADAQSQARDESLTAAQRDKQISDLIGDPSSPSESVKVGPNVFTYPTVGCQYEADKQLYGDVKAWSQAWMTVSQAGAATVNEVANEPAVKEAVTKWSQCMAAANRIYASPGEAVDAGQRMSSDSGGRYVGPTPKETQLAVADATCRASTGYDITLTAATNAAVARYAKQNEGEVLKLMEINTQAQAAARALLK